MSEEIIHPPITIVTEGDKCGKCNVLLGDKCYLGIRPIMLKFLGFIQSAKDGKFGDIKVYARCQACLDATEKEKIVDVTALGYTNAVVKIGKLEFICDELGKALEKAKKELVSVLKVFDDTDLGNTYVAQTRPMIAEWEQALAKWREKE